MCTSLSTNSLSRSSFLRSRGSRAIFVCLVVYLTLCRLLLLLEIQSAFASGLRQCLDPAVVEIAATVEDHFFDALLLRALGDELAHRLCRIDAGAGLETFA